jgi:hypothetical protein
MKALRLTVIGGGSVGDGHRGFFRNCGSTGESSTTHLLSDDMQHAAVHVHLVEFDCTDFGDDVGHAGT